MKNRFFTIFIVFIILFLTILVRLFYWQIIKGGELAAQAAAQYNYIYELKAKRGEIFFSNNQRFVINQPGYLIYANPHEIADKTAFSNLLSPIIQTDPATISAMLKDELFWVAVKKRAPEDMKQQVEALHLPGVGFEDDPLRFYPEASTGAQFLGFVSKDVNGEQKGYFGLEGYYDREIRGRGGVVKTLTDAFGRPILLGDQSKEPITDGRDLLLNIDQTIQYAVENALDRGMEKYGAKGGSVIVMDPKTGAILAMASRPSYDPFHFSDYDQEVYKNPAVASLYEPGSTFKTLVMASAINENVVTPETVCTICAGPVELGGFTIRTWNNQYEPNSTMLDVLIHSDNTGMVFVGKQLGQKKLLEYIRNFGIGTKTNVDLQDEESPLLRADTDWHEIDYATATFGQGLAVTPLQMVRAVGAIANGGLLMEPHMVKAVRKETGEEIPIEPKVVRRVITPTTAKVVTEMMVQAVDKGEAKFAKPKGYRIAGKTGTAQIPIAGHYDPTKTIASFVGFAPADDPKFIMLVKMDQPSSSIFGAETAAPLFFDIAKQLFVYYKVTPTEGN